MPLATAFAPSTEMASCRYEVAWADWERKDGSNTTWVRDLPDRPDLVNAWKKTQNARRAALASQSTSIEICPFLDVHNERTYARARALEERARAQALEEKRRGRAGRSWGYQMWDAEIEKHLHELEMDGDGETGDGTDSPRLLRMSASGETRSRTSSTVGTSSRSRATESPGSTPATSVSGKPASSSSRVQSPLLGASASASKHGSHTKPHSTLPPSKLGKTKTRIESSSEGSEDDAAEVVSITKPSPNTRRLWVTPTPANRPTSTARSSAKPVSTSSAASSSRPIRPLPLKSVSKPKPAVAALSRLVCFQLPQSVLLNQ